MGGSNLRLSLCMIARDERDHLRTCLESVRGLADECIVVDTGSADGTPEIARACGARVIETRWADDFSAPRNAGLDAARGGWILVLDADEHLSAASRDGVRALIEGPPVQAFQLVQASADAGGGTTRVGAVRLFPRHPAVRFEFPIHEQIHASLERAGIPTQAVPIEIAHSGYADPDVRVRKRLRNQRIVEKSLVPPPGGALEWHLRYYRGILFYESGNWAAAAAEFERSLTGGQPPGPAAIRNTRLRAAECLLLAGDLPRAKDHLPCTPDPSEHPAALSLRAEIEVRSGSPAAACLWLEALLGVPPGPHNPPVALLEIQARAIEFIISQFDTNSNVEMVNDMHLLASRIREGQLGVGGATVLTEYHRIRPEPGQKRRPKPSQKA